MNDPKDLLAAAASLHKLVTAGGLNKATERLTRKRVRELTAAYAKAMRIPLLEAIQHLHEATR